MASLPVLLDANALLMPFQFSLDLEGELRRLLGTPRILVPSSVLEELDRLAATKRVARAARLLAERFEVVDVPGRGDDALVEAARARGAVVVTNDRRLRRRLREAGLPVIYLRERSRLEGEGLPVA